MVALKIFLVFAFVHYAFSDRIAKRHCVSESEDFEECVTEVIQDFFQKHSNGLPEHNVKAIDPIIIPDLDIDDIILGIQSTYKNINVTGFKDAIFSDVKINKKEGRTRFNMKFDMVAEGDITTKITQGKTFFGTFKYEGHVKANVKYIFTEKKVNNEVVIYNVGPEIINCDASNVKDSFNQELIDDFDKDPDTQKINAEFQKPGVTEEFNKRIVCMIGTAVIREAIDMIRTIGKMGQ